MQRGFILSILLTMTGAYFCCILSYCSCILLILQKVHGVRMVPGWDGMRCHDSGMGWDGPRMVLDGPWDGMGWDQGWDQGWD